ncbi:MAG: YgiQ family radical SAM protein [Candidatus Cloacimonadaceae bacterium]|jgi:uncharacterized radical SAM protein YgiQ
MAFLVTTQEEMAALGWSELDVILITGDAYVDHPSFGTAVIGRVLEANGYKVGVIAQPDLSNDDDLKRLGRPRLFFGISSGNMDSMVNHYTAQRKMRNNDAYSPDGEIGKRPNRATIIYTNHVKRLFKDVTVVLGGIEASLRRVAHYDFWQDKVRASVLADSKADIIVYGMGERANVEIAQALDAGKSASELQDIRGTVVFASSDDDGSKGVMLPSNVESIDKLNFHKGTQLFWQHHLTEVLYQINGGRLLKHNPPAETLTPAELESVYALPFEREPHPSYEGKTIPAFEQIKDSITSHRGCYGGCNFCTIAAHQGRRISSRGKASILEEATKLAKQHRGKKLTITDVGGPTANMYGSRCKLDWPESCKRRSCLYPAICPNLEYDQQLHLDLLREIEQIPGVGNVFVASGLRHDMAVASSSYIQALATKYAGGRLKLAPEHSETEVLKKMGKPSIDTYMSFSNSFFHCCKKAGLKRQIIPYLIVGHPGADLNSAIAMRKWLIKNRIRVEQVQEFTPTPMTISTSMYYTGLDFETGKPIHVPKPAEVRKQKEIIMWHKKR